MLSVPRASRTFMPLRRSNPDARRRAAFWEDFICLGRNNVMCGIAGWIDLKGRSDRHGLEFVAAQMAEALSHRGPDDRGVWADPEAAIGLGHRRLSVLDLSSAGRQPMISSSGRFVISYNGEIYNCEEIRQELKKINPRLGFRGHSDTEIMLAAFEQWGIEPSLQRMNGMFAFALWDRSERTLFLVRDRFGEKPLYYGTVGGAFLFASELKAFLEYPAFAPEIDREAVVRYLQFSCIPAPYSIYRGIYKLLPGTILRWKNGEVRISTYWSVLACLERAASQPYEGSETDAIAELDRLLRDAVRMRMNADVPVGAFLSGGIDSSLIVALMRAQSKSSVQTFTIGFHDPAYDEAPDAQAVARHLGTDHTELYVTAAEAIRMVRRLPEVYDEPFADSSQLPTLLISQLARQHVVVSLSGDGGDEVFGGYNRYTFGARLWKWIKRTPKALRRLSATAITGVEPQRWESFFGLLRPILRAGLRQRNPGYKLHKLAHLLSSADCEDMYARMSSHWLLSERATREAISDSPRRLNERERTKLPSFALQAMYLDSITFLPNDILAKVDRATMAFGLESRIPFLDHRIVEFAWRLPLEMKVRPYCGKWIVRQVLQRYVPPELTERPKMGFGVPLDVWLRTSLRDWAETLLDSKRMDQEGFFDSAAIRKKWDAHQEGRGNWHYHLWDVLMFQSWLENQSARQPRHPSLATA
jgi:asparagine synthase (glutamine-hydrolysing)